LQALGFSTRDIEFGLRALRTDELVAADAANGGGGGGNGNGNGGGGGEAAFNKLLDFCGDLSKLVEMGYNKEVAASALLQCREDINGAVDFIEQHLRLEAQMTAQLSAHEEEEDAAAAVVVNTATEMVAVAAAAKAVAAATPVADVTTPVSVAFVTASASVEAVPVSSPEFRAMGNNQIMPLAQPAVAAALATPADAAEFLKTPASVRQFLRRADDNAYDDVDVVDVDDTVNDDKDGNDNAGDIVDADVHDADAAADAAAIAESVDASRPDGIFASSLNAVSPISDSTAAAIDPDADGVADSTAAPASPLVAMSPASPHAGSPLNTGWAI
jgi:hypothetical protein